MSTRTQWLLAGLLVVCGQVAAAPKALLLAQGLNEFSEAGEIVRLVDRTSPDCRYFGTLMYTPPAPAEAANPFLGRAAALGVWWINVKDGVCLVGGEVAMLRGSWTVPLNPLRRYPAGTEVSALGAD